MGNSTTVLEVGPMDHSMQHTWWRTLKCKKGEAIIIFEEWSPAFINILGDGSTDYFS